MHLFFREFWGMGFFSTPEPRRIFLSVRFLGPPPGEACKKGSMGG